MERLHRLGGVHPAAERHRRSRDLAAARGIRGRDAGRHDVVDGAGPRGPAARTGLRTRRSAALAAHHRMTRDYVFDQGFAQERERLSAMESLWDPGSQALLDDLGVGPGGGASRSARAAARWCDGWPSAAPTSRPSISTPGSSIISPPTRSKSAASTLRADELPQSEFDLVHARLVLEHLTDRRQILARLAHAAAGRLDRHRGL